jgi:hypothetical protein
MCALSFVCGVAAPCPHAQEPRSSPWHLPKHLAACLSLPRCHPRLLRLLDGLAIRDVLLGTRAWLRNASLWDRDWDAAIRNVSQWLPARMTSRCAISSVLKGVHATFSVSQLTAAAQSRLKWPRCPGVVSPTCTGHEEEHALAPCSRAAMSE